MLCRAKSAFALRERGAHRPRRCKLYRFFRWQGLDKGVKPCGLGRSCRWLAGASGVAEPLFAALRWLCSPVGGPTSIAALLPNSAWRRATRAAAVLAWLAAHHGQKSGVFCCWRIVRSERLGSRIILRSGCQRARVRPEAGDGRLEVRPVRRLRGRIALGLQSPVSGLKPVWIIRTVYETSRVRGQFQQLFWKFLESRKSLG